MLVPVGAVVGWLAGDPPSGSAWSRRARDEAGGDRSVVALAISQRRCYRSLGVSLRGDIVARLAAGRSSVELRQPRRVVARAARRCAPRGARLRARDGAHWQLGARRGRDRRVLSAHSGREADARRVGRPALSLGQARTADLARHPRAGDGARQSGAPPWRGGGDGHRPGPRPRPRHALVADFPVRPRRTLDRAPAALAAAMRAPLVVAVSRRLGDEQRMEVLSVLLPPDRGRTDWVVTATRAATRSLDRRVHAHPSEWLWMHRRWKPAPPDGVTAQPRVPGIGRSTAPPSRRPYGSPRRGLVSRDFWRFSLGSAASVHGPSCATAAAVNREAEMGAQHGIRAAPNVEWRGPLARSGDARVAGVDRRSPARLYATSLNGARVVEPGGRVGRRRAAGGPFSPSPSTSSTTTGRGPAPRRPTLAARGAQSSKTGSS